MKQRNIFLSVILIVSICVICAIVATATEKTSIFYQLGLLERPIQTKNSAGKELAFKGDTIEVSNEELHLIISRKNIVGENNAEETAIAYLLQREALYNLAVKENKEATDEEILAEIEYMKEFFKRDDVDNLHEGLEMISATGLTIDQYFDAQYDTYKKQLSASNYLQPYIEEFVKEKGKPIGDVEVNAEWRALVKGIADEYIAKDNVKDLRNKNK